MLVGKLPRFMQRLWIPSAKCNSVMRPALSVRINPLRPLTALLVLIVSGESLLLLFKLIIGQSEEVCLGCPRPPLLENLSVSVSFTNP